MDLQNTFTENNTTTISTAYSSSETDQYHDNKNLRELDNCSHSNCESQPKPLRLEACHQPIFAPASVSFRSHINRSKSSDIISPDSGFSTSGDEFLFSSGATEASVFKFPALDTHLETNDNGDDNDADADSDIGVIVQDESNSNISESILTENSTLDFGGNINNGIDHPHIPASDINDSTNDVINDISNNTLFNNSNNMNNAQYSTPINYGFSEYRTTLQPQKDDNRDGIAQDTVVIMETPNVNIMMSPESALMAGYKTLQDSSLLKEVMDTVNQNIRKDTSVLFPSTSDLSLNANDSVFVWEENLAAAQVPRTYNLTDYVYKGTSVTDLVLCKDSSTDGRYQNEQADDNDDDNGYDDDFDRSFRSLQNRIEVGSEQERKLCQGYYYHHHYHDYDHHLSRRNKKVSPRSREKEENEEERENEVEEAHIISDQLDLELVKLDVIVESLQDLEDQLDLNDAVEKAHQLHRKSQSEYISASTNNTDTRIGENSFGFPGDKDFDLEVRGNIFKSPLRRICK